MKISCLYPMVLIMVFLLGLSYPAFSWETHTECGLGEPKVYRDVSVWIVCKIGGSTQECEYECDLSKFPIICWTEDGWLGDDCWELFFNEVYNHCELVDPLCEEMICPDANHVEGEYCRKYCVLCE